VREVAARYGGRVDVRIYQAGRDVAYLPKYGPVMRGTLFIDERVRLEHLTRPIIEDAIARAVEDTP
jgi:hypothetical protein